VTNDFPPRAGGIQSFVHALVERQPPDSVVVYAPAWEGAARFDAGLSYPVVRHPGRLMLPVPSVAQRARAVARRFGADAVLFGAAAPLGLLAPGLRTAGIRRAVALTHGHEASWARVPGGRDVLRRIASGLDALTFLGSYTGGFISRALRPADRGKLVRLHPGVDTARFRPDVGGSARRAALGLSGRPVVVCVSRLVRRKGQDVLIQALPAIRDRVPGAALLIVGGGPDLRRLRDGVAAVGLVGEVIFTGSVAEEELPSYYGAGDVFAMPCRTRRGGLDVEGLGMVFLEASACGLPVVAGDSGGAPDAVQPGRTGTVVNGRDPGAVASAVAGLLLDPERADAMGRCGRAWAAQEWSWELQARRLTDLLRSDAGSGLDA
jgi:phosphatidylinositol alpha-1,6-mannosyltransferase